jgi:glycosyltransferase involved in cell wall biosynthesis
MRVALLTDGIYPYVIGGMQKHSFYLVKYFAREGVHVDLYHFNQGDYRIEELEFFTDEEKKFIRPTLIKFPAPGKFPGHYIRESYQYAVQVYHALMKNEPADFIYAKGFSGWKLAEEKKKGRKVPPFGVNFHGFEMFQPNFGLRSRLSAYLLRGPVRFNVQHADHVFSYGGKISAIIENLGVPRERIITIPTGIESSWLNDSPAPSGTKRRFIFVGRCERRKGMEEINQALGQLKGLDISVEFVGPVPASQQLGLPFVTYHGIVRETDKMTSLLRGADILLCPSHSEGMPNVIMEAMASGLAVIATDVGAVACVVGPDNGWIVEPGNVESLRKTMAEAVAVPASHLDSMKSRSVQKIAEQFTWEKLIRTTIREIEKRISK